MSTTLALFTDPKYDNSIVRQEIHTYHPHTKSFDSNDSIEISINQQDTFVNFSESALKLEGIFTPGADGNGDCSMTNNAGLALFSEISFELNGVLIERVRDPGVTTCIRAMLAYNTDESRALYTAGWNPFRHLKTNNNRFCFWIPLSFIFSVFYDYRKVLIGRHVFRLTRAIDDSNCYISKTADEAFGTKKATITLTNIEIKAMHVYPNDQLKLEILENISKNKPIMIPFRYWELYENPALNDATKGLWSVKTSSSVERPVYVVAAFHNKRKNNYQEDSNLFDPMNITDIKLQLNSEYYPYENMRLNFENDKYTEAYHAYLDVVRSYTMRFNAEPILSYDDFKKHCLFAFNCSKKEQEIRSSTVDIKLLFESSNQFSANCRAYCLIAHDRVVNVYPMTGNINMM